MVLKYSEFHACDVNQTETSAFARAKNQPQISVCLFLKIV